MSEGRVHADLGYTICNHVQPYIPRSITPNQMTLFNHVLNWFLLYLSWLGGDVTLGLQDRQNLLLVCSAVNFVCMMLDCLDGMHARRTGQCSKVLDAFSSPHRSVD